MRRGALAALVASFLGALQLPSSPSLASGSLERFVTSLANRIEDKAREDGIRDILLKQVPQLNDKLLRLSTAMSVLAAMLEKILLLDGQKISSIQGSLLTDSFNAEYGDLERALREVADAIGPLEVPLTDFNLRSAIDLQRVFGSRAQVVLGLRFVRINDPKELRRIVDELREVSERTEQLTLELDKLRKTGQSPVAEGQP